MQLDIVTPDRRVIVGQASDIVIPGLEGEFDVLPGHAPVLSMLGTGILRFSAEGKDVQLMVSGGFVEVDNDRIVLMCESATLASEVVVEQERKSLHALEQKLQALGSTAPDDADYLQVKAEVDRAAARLNIGR